MRKFGLLLLGTILGLGFCVGSLAFGAERNQSPANPPPAQAPARSLKSDPQASKETFKLADFHLLSGNFVQTKFFKEMDVRIETKGKFRIAKPATAGASTVHWDIEQPQPARICIDGTSIVVGSAAAPAAQKKLNFSEVSAETGSQISGLMKLMTMDARQINTEFAVQKKGQAYVLTPKNPATAFFVSARVELSSEGFANKVLIQEKTGDELNLQFSGLKIGEPLVADQGCSH